MNIIKRKVRIIHPVRKILPRNKGEISTSITKNWTEQAISCYKSNFNCTECSIMTGNYSFVCQMPKVIEILINDIGLPEDEIDPILKKFA
ncbi:MAG: hypothetical protein WC197_07535 [Candidatus Gastranaerophilaceae bacterium]|jgi:hypothetical protein